MSCNYWALEVNAEFIVPDIVEQRDGNQMLI